MIWSKQNWEKNWLGLKRGCQKLRKGIAQRQLENELSSIVRTVSGHKKNKLLQGASQYQSLWKVANSKVKQFCLDYGVETSEIEAQIPALKELQTLAEPAPASNRKIWAIQGILTGTVGIVLLGFLTSLVQHLFTWGFNLAHWIASHL